MNVRLNWMERGFNCVSFVRLIYFLEMTVRLVPALYIVIAGFVKVPMTRRNFSHSRRIRDFKKD
jgi:hypothetical protein